MQPRQGSTEFEGAGRASLVAMVLAAAAWGVVVWTAWTMAQSQGRETSSTSKPSSEQSALAEKLQTPAMPPEGWLVVAGGDAKLRVGPTVRTEVIRELAPGSTLRHVFGGGPWVMVALPGEDEKVGWVHRSLVRGKGFEAAAAVAPRAPRRDGSHRMPLIAERGFSSFWNEADKLSKALDCPVPEVELGKQNAGARYLCRFGPKGRVTLSMEGRVASTQVEQVRLVWTRPFGDPRETVSARPEARRLAQGLAGLYGGLLREHLVARFFDADQGAADTGEFRISYRRTRDEAAERRSLVISSR
ncbi:MAG: hypothetical protein OEM59_08540 [Rhodospirillales bacterium]|nr:hypothetical protein [Rhodospirillales bacterium]